MLLSVVVAAPEGSDTKEFLAAMAEDGFLVAADVEIILVGPSFARQTPIADNVCSLTINARASIFALWGAGIRNAQAPSIALMDARCPPVSGWLEAVRAKLPVSRAAMFGPVQSGIACTDPEIVGYLVEYAQFAPPLSPRLSETPGLNLIVTKEAAHDPRVLCADGFVKTRLLAALAQDGAPPPAANDGAIVRYCKRYGFVAYCRHRFRHARCYAAERSLNTLQRLAAILTTPALPFLRTWRIIRNVRGHSQLLGATFRYLHRTIVAESAWALGEFVGYLSGAGRTRRLLS